MSILLKQRNLLPIKYFKSLLSSTAAPPLNENKIELFINDQRVLAEPGMTILQACALIGIEIPRYCYHERLSIAGNCRMCLVEVEKSVKPVASCAMPVMKGMRVKTDTNSAVTRKAREGVTEFLLVNHPLDCPICDQAGECDLQDQTMAFGNDRSRFVDMWFSGKRAVEDKNIGPLIKTSMNRCIHCTKCIRFASEIAGVDDLGTTGRGSDMQVGTFVEKMFYSELSGNVIDLCPVGALTSKPYAFRARPWETRKTESVDIMDAVGSNIVVSSRAGDIMRILPKINDDINEEWISDKTRFAYDGLKYQRLTSPMIKGADGSFRNYDWEHALNFLTQKLVQTDANKIMGIVGSSNDAESMAAFKELFNRLGCGHHVFSEDYFPAHLANQRSAYLFNTSIAGIEMSDLILIVGCNPRLEAPIINARIRKTWLQQEAQVAYIGESVNLAYEYEHIGTRISDLLELCKNPSNHAFGKRLMQAKSPMIILGYTAVKNENGEDIMNAVLKLSSQLQSNIKDENWKVFNLLHTKANMVGALDLSLNCGDLNNLNQHLSKHNPEIIYLFGVDDNNHVLNQLRDYKKQKQGNCTIIYQGHHGDIGASLADYILPGCAYTEKTGTYINTEGRSQTTLQAITPPGRAKEDWKILRALSEFIHEFQVIHKLVSSDPLSLPRGTQPNVSAKSLTSTLSGIGELDQELQTISTDKNLTKHYVLPYEDLRGVRHLLHSLAAVRNGNILNYGVINANSNDAQYEELMSFVRSSEQFDSHYQKSLRKLEENKNFVLKPEYMTLKEFYMTNTISRASVTMAKCVQAAREAEKTKYFTQQENLRIGAA